MMTELARDIPSWGDIPRLIDSTPVPCGKSRETVKRSDLAGQASYGYCASNSRHFWGLRLYLICAPDGMPVVWGLANPKLGERKAAETMLRQDRHLIRPGQVIVGDKGFAGRKFENFITAELEAELIRPARKDETNASGNSAESDNGSSPCSTPSKANSPSRTTAAAPSWACTPVSPPDYSPSPPEFGTTGSSEHPTNHPSSPTTIRTPSSRSVRRGMQVLGCVPERW